VPIGEDAQWVVIPSFDSVIICEGEWDMLRLHDHGFDNAVTHTAGAGTWLVKWNPLFAGKKVFICFDRDRVGQQGAAKVAHNLFPVAKEVRLVDLPLPGTPEANDVSDYWRLGGTLDGFRELLRKARPYIPANRASGRRGGLHGKRFYAHRA
jgi:DNA primase